MPKKAWLTSPCTDQPREDWNFVKPKPAAIKRSSVAKVLG